MLEVVHLLRDSQPISDAEAAPLRLLLGVEPPKRTGWKRFIGA
jgi:hypothetical protein